MSAVLLAVHVLAGIVFVGPVTVAASLFPRYAREGSVGVVDALHRISRVYAVLGLAVPVFGIATAAQLGVLGDTWLIVSMAMTLAAALLLGLVILPAQAAVVAGLHERGAAIVPPRLSMTTGVFALIWAVVVVLMIVRPGSTTGVGA
jgi:hypothetical protein